PRLRDRLNALKVNRVEKPGRYADGGGLYLQIKSEGAKSWLFRYRIGGAKWPREMGLGAVADVTLAEARAKAAEARKLLDAGTDPLVSRRQAEAAAALEAVRGTTFKECAAEYLAGHKDSWRSAKHAAQWESSL